MAKQQTASVASEPFHPGKPKAWEVTAGFRWARPGLWTPVASRPHDPYSEIVSNDGLGGRVVRPAFGGGYDVWQVRIDCAAASGSVTEGVRIDQSGHHVQGLSPSAGVLDAASVKAFCSRSAQRPGGLEVADALLPRATAPAYTHAVPPSRASLVPRLPSNVPAITPDAVKRMESERRQALGGGR